MLCINVPIIFISIKFIGKSFAAKTVLTMCISSFSVDFIREILMLEGITTNLIIASVIGGIILGFGLGLIIAGNSSAGGLAIIAKMIAEKTNQKQEHIIILFDALIVIAAGFVFNNIESTLWSLIGVFMSLKGIWLILYLEKKCQNNL